MNTIRLIAIALPMALLLACGGGGSSGGVTVAPTPTMMNPPTNMTPPDNTPEPLPTAPINATTARSHFTGSTVPSTMTPDAVEQAFRSRASATGAEVLFEDIVEIGESARTTSCAGTTCTGTLSDNTSLEYSFSEFGNTPEINSQSLLGFNDAYELVMMDEGVTLVQGRAAGRLEGTSYEFLNYGGWLANSAFGVQFEMADGSGNNDLSYLTAYSFGVHEKSNPSVTSGRTIWHGVVVGASEQTGDFVQGRVQFEISIDAPNTFSAIRFTEIYNLITNTSINSLIWSGIGITDGTFKSDDDSLQGAFYGDGHTEVGGTFNRNGIIGAFGGTRQ